MCNPDRVSDVSFSKMNFTCYFPGNLSLKTGKHGCNITHIQNNYYFQKGLQG